MQLRNIFSVYKLIMQCFGASELNILFGKQGAKIFHRLIIVCCPVVIQIRNNIGAFGNCLNSH